MPGRNRALCTAAADPPVEVPPPYEQAIVAPAPPAEPAAKSRDPLPKDIRDVIDAHYIPQFEDIVRKHEPPDFSMSSKEVGKWKGTTAELIVNCIHAKEAPFNNITSQLRPDAKDKD
ncbi:hypothetical protein BT96DRAFT_994717 [Gymnopus androsaceus JB14]|uniref:Uncharacterized protein n=1 Tax=Gymnopus androsaceus JB14 TaxID=1447944 RepID=A0A6A4HIL8_9AGAR|nr:hypothetical protein BT96DRAFT_994717 [Gymnopus androsaceus JB14]